MPEEVGLRLANFRGSLPPDQPYLAGANDHVENGAFAEAQLLEPSARQPDEGHTRRSAEPAVVCPSDPDRARTRFAQLEQVCDQALSLWMLFANCHPDI
jgi:hypothetical protein